MSDSRLREIEELLVRLWTEGQDDFCDEKPDLRGASVYASVLKANRLDTMKAIYPRTCQVAAEQWERLVLAYCKKVPELARNRPRRCNRFLLNNMGVYFHDYFLQEESQLAAEYPYLADLIHFEAAEAELGESDLEIPDGPAILKDAGQFASLSPIINPCLKVLRYRFDIPAIIAAIDLRGDNTEPLAFAGKDMVLLAVRNPRSHKIRVIEVNELTALIVETALAGVRSYQDLLALAADHCLLPRESLAQHCMALFIELKDQFVIVGDHFI